MAQVPWTQWLTETGFVLCSYIEEVLGHPAMASMGRMRRRMAAASLLQLICGQISPVLLELPQLTQVMSVTMRALNETPQFEVSTSAYKSPRKLQCLGHAPIPWFGCYMSAVTSGTVPENTRERLLADSGT